MIQRFQYHALAIGFGGEIIQPFREIIPVQASLALPERGGFGSSRVNCFNFRDIISFTSAYSVVAGSYSEGQRTWDTLATSVIEGLDILGVVTAQRIVARIACSYPADGGEPSITPAGSGFEGLRIAGREPRVDLAVDTFARLSTDNSVRDAYRGNKDGFRDEFRAMAPANRGDKVPERLRAYFPAVEGASADEIPERNGVVECSLVRGISEVGRELSCFGHAIHVKGFGVIRLAEFRVSKFLRRITMLQVDLGSTPVANFSHGTAEGNGTGW